MANWDLLKESVANVITANGNQEITGDLLQSVLNNIISNVGKNATFGGIATPSTNPGAPDGPVFYLATTAGTYSNFEGITLNNNEAAIFVWINGLWIKQTSGFATQEAVDSVTETTAQHQEAIANEVKRAKEAEELINQQAEQNFENFSALGVEESAKTDGYEIALTKKTNTAEKTKVKVPVYSMQNPSATPVGLVDEIFVEDMNTNIGITEYPVFSASKPYAADDVVRHEGLLYRFKVAHEAGIWDDAQVEPWSEKKEREKEVSELGSKVNNNTESIKALNGYNIYSEEYKVFGKGISYDFAILSSNFYKKGTSFSLNVEGIDGVSVMLRKRLDDYTKFAPTILTVNGIGSGEVVIPEDGKYALLFYKTVAEKSDAQHEYSVTYTANIKNTNIQNIENDIKNIESLEKEDLGYKHLRVQEKGEVIEQFSIVNSDGKLRRFFENSSDSENKAAPIYANTSIDAKNGIICDSYIDKQIGNPWQMRCVAIKKIEGEKHIYGKVGKISFPESQEDRPFVLVRFYSIENENVGQFFLYENEENNMPVPQNASYVLVFEYLSLERPINGGEYVFNDVFVYTDISNKVLDSKIKNVESSIPVIPPIPDIGKALFDDDTVKAKGNGSAYDYFFKNEYTREDISVDYINISVGDIVIPEGGIEGKSCIVYRELNAEGGRITNVILYANTSRTVTINPNTKTIVIIVYLSTDNNSIKDGEYIFKNLSIKITGKYDVFAIPSLIKEVGLTNRDWSGKNIATYGDSITAINNGDFVKPFNGTAWGNIVASYFGFEKHFGRGVGSQKFAWGSNGGAVVFVNEQTGAYVDRNNSYNYDNYVGNVDVPSGSIAVRGCSCSWLRITKMFPESIKDTINVVTIMYHNDASDSLVDTELEFVSNDATDTEWKNSNYYNTYGGDYNIKTVRGGIASTIMKMQAWMPNAVIILCTPISGRFTEGQLNMQLKDKSMQLVAEIVRDMSKLMSIPIIDVYATCGINGLNRTRFITDGIHPYSAAGNKMVARAIIGGLKTILPL